MGTSLTWPIPMCARIDTSAFPVGKDLDYEGEEERGRLAALRLK
jgi:hypothetical protein